MRFRNTYMPEAIRVCSKHTQCFMWSSQVSSHDPGECLGIEQTPAFKLCAICHNCRPKCTFILPQPKIYSIGFCHYYLLSHLLEKTTNVETTNTNYEQGRPKDRALSYALCHIVFSWQGVRNLHTITSIAEIRRNPVVWLAPNTIYVQLVEQSLMTHTVEYFGEIKDYALYMFSPLHLIDNTFLRFCECVNKVFSPKQLSFLRNNLKTINKLFIYFKECSTKTKIKSGNLYTAWFLIARQG